MLVVCHTKVVLYFQHNGSAGLSTPRKVLGELSFGRLLRALEERAGVLSHTGRSCRVREGLFHSPCDAGTSRAAQEGGGGRPASGGPGAGPVFLSGLSPGWDLRGWASSDQGLGEGSGLKPGTSSEVAAASQLPAAEAEGDELRREDV